MEHKETPRMRKYGESKTTRNMMATVRHVTSGAGRTKFQTAWFLLNIVYIRNVYCRMLHEGKKSKKPKLKYQQVLQYARKTMHQSVYHTIQAGFWQRYRSQCRLCVYLTADNTEILSHVPPSQHPQMNSFRAGHSVHYPLLYTLSSVTVLIVQRCTPNHW